MNDYEYSKDGLALTEKFEGYRLSAYSDGAGISTIGYGHTKDVHLGDTCTQQQAEQWLLDDVQEAVEAVKRLVTVELTQAQFDSLVDFVFNLGATKFANSTLLKDINSGVFANAAHDIGMWDKVAGQVSVGIERRRDAEGAEFNS